jgi:hypothetical protein
MTRLRGYAAEVTILLLGSGATLVEFFVFGDKKFGFLVFTFGLLLSSAVLIIRLEIEERVSHDLDRTVMRIEPASWRNKASDRIQELGEELREWADGRMALSRDAAIPHQIDLLGQARDSVFAVHLALGDAEDKTRLWTKSSGRFHDLVQSHRALRPEVEKRRIFIFDDEDDTLVTNVGDNKILCNGPIIDVCRQQLAPPEEGGLGVTLRILWKTEFERLDRDLPPDLLIVDRREVVIVDVSSQTYFDGHAIVSPSRVSSHCQSFDAYWGAAVDAAECLPALPAPALPAPGTPEPTTETEIPLPVLSPQARFDESPANRGAPAENKAEE